MDSITVAPANWTRDSDALRLVRTRVFIEEQSVPEALEWDGADELASHWLARNDRGQPIGTVRMLNDGHIGRMAVLPIWRKQGVATALLNAVLDHARQRQLFEVYLYAQTHAVDFYRRAGFIGHGEEFMDAYIPHLTMRLQLAERRLLGVHSGNFVPSSLAEAAVDIIEQTHRQLRILSYDLDPAAFDNSRIEASISALARKSRYTGVRLLVVNADNIVKRGHRLLNLQRRLSSSIKIRRVSNEPHEVRDNLIIADQCGIVCQSMREPETLWANYNNRPVALNYLSQFDDLWERGIFDHNLKQVDI